MILQNKVWQSCQILRQHWCQGIWSIRSVSMSSVFETVTFIGSGVTLACFQTSGRASSGIEKLIMVCTGFTIL